MHFSTESDFCTISLEGPFNCISPGLSMTDGGFHHTPHLENNVPVKLGQ